MKITLGIKPKYFIFGYLVALITLPIFAWIILLIIAAFDVSSSPNNWSPYFNFYRSYECVSTKNNNYPNCLITGLRAKASNNSLSKTLNEFRLYSVEFLEKNKINFSNWQCREFASKRLLSPLEITKNGESYECWPNNPIPQELFLYSNLK